MTDLGLYNFIKEELSQGRTKEQIGASLMQGGGWTLSDIDAAFIDIEKANTLVSSGNQIQISPQKNKARTALIIGLITLLSWIIPFINVNVSPIVPFSVWIVIVYIASGLAVIGTIIGLLGFRAHKLIATAAIILCLINIIPAIIIGQLSYKTGLIGNTVYNDPNFSIQIPRGWVKTTPQVEAKSLRAAFVPQNNTDTYQPHIFVTSARNEQTTDTESFGKIREQQIKTDSGNTFLFGKLQSFVEPYVEPDGTGKKFYIIRYTFENEGKKIMMVEFLTVKNSIGYIISASAEEATYEKLSNQVDKPLQSSMLSFTAKE